jgi:hypothetical protein
MSDEDARLTWLDKAMITLLSGALVLIFGTVLFAGALIVFWFA